MMDKLTDLEWECVKDAIYTEQDALRDELEEEDFAERSLALDSAYTKIKETMT